MCTIERGQLTQNSWWNCRRLLPEDDWFRYTLLWKFLFIKLCDSCWRRIIIMDAANLWLILCIVDNAADIVDAIRLRRAFVHFGARSQWHKAGGAEVIYKCDPFVEFC